MAASRWTAQHPCKCGCSRNAEKDPGAIPASVSAAGDRAYLVYFVHQSGEPEAEKDAAWERRSVLQVAELKEADGRISVDRTAPVEMRLQP